MTPEAQRIAIAEACIRDYNCCRCGERSTLIRYAAPFCSEECAERAGDFALDDGQQAISDYLNDLNAMHEAEKVLTVNQWDEYLVTLYNIAQSPHICATTHDMAYVCATAAQRAEAFLRTLGEWDAA